MLLVKSSGADNTLGALTTGSLAGTEDVKVDGTMRVTGQLHIGTATITIDPETDSLDLNGVKLEKIQMEILHLRIDKNLKKAKLLSWKLVVTTVKTAPNKGKNLQKLMFKVMLKEIDR